MSRIGFVAIGVAGLVVAGGVGAFLTMRDAIAREDVGDLDALKPVQEQITGFTGCAIRYRTHQRMSSDQVLVESCGEPTSTAWLKVPAGWKFPDLAFEAKRDNANRRWQIYVDKSKISLDTLVTALTQLTPSLVTDGSAALANKHAADQAYDRGKADRDSAAHDQAEQNRASYSH